MRKTGRRDEGLLAKYSISIDREGCLADTICTAICPENWYIGDDGKAHFREGIIGDADYKCNHEAAMSCPTGIIKIRKIE